MSQILWLNLLHSYHFYFWWHDSENQQCFLFVLIYKKEFFRLKAHLKIVMKSTLYKFWEVNLVELTQFVAVTKHFEFCLRKTLLYIDPRNNFLKTIDIYLKKSTIRFRLWTCSSSWTPWHFGKLSEPMFFQHNLTNTLIISFSGGPTQIQKRLTTATFFSLHSRHLKAAGSGSPCCTRLKNLNFSPISAALVNIL